MFSSSFEQVMSGRTPGLAATPQRRDAAIRLLQKRETTLEPEELVDLVELFTERPALGDVYVSLASHTRSPWIARQLKVIANARDEKEREREDRERERAMIRMGSQSSDLYGNMY
jgi:hypothetical protein